MAPKAKARIFDYVVEENEMVADGICRMVVSVPEELTRTLAPGMFLNFNVPGDPSQMLRIPLSFASAKDGRVELVYAVVGDGTARLSCMVPGDGSTVVGPLGNGWWVPEGSGRALVVGGGVGLPPVMAAAELLRSNGFEVDAIVGAQTARKHWRDGLERLEGMGVTVYAATDDGTFGEKGFTTDVMRRLVSESDYAAVLTCGPTPMMAGVAAIAAKESILCEASLERMMTCGFGACSTCNVEMVSGGYKLCCSDGPVFDAKEVVW